MSIRRHSFQRPERKTRSFRDCHFFTTERLQRGTYRKFLPIRHEEPSGARLVDERPEEDPSGRLQGFVQFEIAQLVLEHDTLDRRRSLRPHKELGRTRPFVQLLENPRKFIQGKDTAVFGLVPQHRSGQRRLRRPPIEEFDFGEDGPKTRRHVQIRESGVSGHLREPGHVRNGQNERAAEKPRRFGVPERGPHRFGRNGHCVEREFANFERVREFFATGRIHIYLEYQIGRTRPVLERNRSVAQLHIRHLH